MKVRVQRAFSGSDGRHYRYGDEIEIDESHPAWQRALDDGLVKQLDDTTAGIDPRDVWRPGE